MPKAKPTAKIHAAAFYFAHISRDVREIAEVFDASVWTVRNNWSETPEWHDALDAFAYDGDRHFIHRKTRDTLRENGEDFKKVRDSYLRKLADGVPVHRLPAQVSEETGVSKRRIAQWAERFGWKKGGG